jgi:FKBP-type peptidyl-prolyl cis-trans isomerase SlyD
VFSSRSKTALSTTKRARSADAVSEFQVGPDTFVTLSYSVFDAEGDVVADQSQLSCVFGRGQLLPAIEHVLDGMSAGERRTLTLKARDAYGKRDPKAVIEVDRDEFPEDVAPGDRFEMENEAGGLLVLQVLDVGPDSVVVDLNHPLAGQDIRVELHVHEVRPATTSELAEAESMLEEQAALEAEAFSAGLLPDGPTPGLVSVESLLRGRSRSYEKDPDEVPNLKVSKSGDADEH